MMSERGPGSSSWQRDSLTLAKLEHQVVLVEQYDLARKSTKSKEYVGRRIGALPNCCVRYWCRQTSCSLSQHFLDISRRCWLSPGNESRARRSADDHPTGEEQTIHTAFRQGP
ncbi:hypothetical protein TNCV_516611 [Trichonephila clavipes]|nr:hypothetical protein TNCV_516611 [Trichonephila clavipes]